MLALANATCSSCDNPFIAKGLTRVRYSTSNKDRTTVVKCVECDPSLLIETAESDDIDPDKIRLVTLRVLVKRYENDLEGSWCVYICDLIWTGESRPAWAPDELHLGAKAIKPFTVVGPLGIWNKQDLIDVYGKFTIDTKRGLQFQVLTRASPNLTSCNGLDLFLRKIIGESAVTDLLKLHTVENVIKILDNKEAIDLFPLDAGVATQVQEAYNEQSYHKVVASYCTGLCLSDQVISAAIDKWDRRVMEEIEKDAFVLLELDPVSFECADKAFLGLKNEASDPRRVRAAICYTLKQEENEGHCWIAQDVLLNTVTQKYGFDPALTDREMLELCSGDTSKLVPVDTKIYFRSVWTKEQYVASRLRTALAQPSPRLNYAETIWQETVPNALQRLALDNAAMFSVSIITGSPGSGKSFVTRTLLDLFESNSCQVVCCAPTGRAAKRMQELTGRPASTVHRLLGSGAFADNAFVDKKIECDVLIVDEVSMISLDLMFALLKHLPNNARLVFIGDVDQLPSIDPGQVLADLISCKAVPTVTLSQVYRQSETSRVLAVAKDINKGLVSDLKLKGTDFNFFELKTEQEIQDGIVECVTEILPKKYGFDPSEIQVLCPQKGDSGKNNWPIGTCALNAALQSALNPHVVGDEVRIGYGYVARKNDRVIHRKNDYELEVFNGDIGRVVQCSKKVFTPGKDVVTSARRVKAKLLDAPTLSDKRKTRSENDVLLVVEYDGRQVGYNKSELRELQLAYALTVHSMQGSQCKAVVMPCHYENRFALHRAVLYTAITRAQKYCLIMGQSVAYKKAVSNVRDLRRRTGLATQLQPQLET